MNERSQDRCPQNDPSVVAELIGASKVFKSGGQEIVALQKTDLHLKRSQLLLIVGPSGSGKTTLLSLLGCVLYPTEGCVCIRGINTKDLNERQLAGLRRSFIGFVFQNFNLVSPLNSEENIMLPLLLSKLPGDAVRERARRAQELVGLAQRRKSFPKQLSGGEQQRVAIARALVSDPAIILCDEPTAALDAGSLETVMEELRHLADRGKSVAVVTHDPRLSKYADRIIHMENGKVIEKTAGEGMQ
ncbi:MAG: ABC transporter ATP-binding protein [Candidatus Aminicenantales bacterium]